MPGPGTEKHYAGRYICQKDARTCDGKVRGDGGRVPCPIACRCKGSQEPQGQLERFWPVGRYGKLLIRSSPNWTREHTRRLNDAKNVFAKEEMRAYYAGYRKRNPEKAERAQREFWAREERRRQAALGVEDRREEWNRFGAGARHLLLPCGEDCRNCPLPEGPAACPYTDEDEDRLMELEYGKKGGKGPARHPQGVRRICKAAEPPTAALCPAPTWTLKATP